ncbi:MAG: hypothetical protein ACI81V_000464 [Lentimonas sp.]|jgi:hypothetical protein
MKYKFIEEYNDQYQVSEICECFDVKTSGDYA